MNKGFYISILALFTIFSINCGGTDEANQNGNANQEIIVTSSSNSNENTANDMPDVVPTFTNPDEALAAGDKYLDLSNLENAIESYKQAIKLNPDLADAHFKLGIAYSLQEKVEEINDDEAEEEPTPTPSKGKKGKKEEKALTNADKSFQNAVTAYKKIIKKDPKNDAAHFNLGRSYNKLNEDTDAEKALRQAVKLKPDDAEYQTELGAILVKLAKYDEAVIALKKALEIDENHSLATELLEKAEAGKKRVEFARKNLPDDRSKQPVDNQRARPTPKPKVGEPTPPPILKSSNTNSK